MPPRAVPLDRRKALAGRAAGRLHRAKIAPRHQIQFFRQMEMLLSSGILIVDALARLKERYPDGRTRRVLGEMHAHVVQSRCSLSRALALFPRSFPPGIVAVIEAGEEGGTARLADRFADLAERTAYAQANRQQVRKACAYPLLVIAMAAGLYALLLVVVFPRLAGLLTSLGANLPPLTRGMIAVSHAAQGHWRLLLAVFAGGPILLAASRRCSAAILPLDRLFLRLPLVGRIYQCLTVALICKIYRSLYDASKPAPEIIGLCAQLMGNACFGEGLRKARSQVETGRASLAEALAQSGLFPPLACLAIDVGEQSGQLSQALDRVAVFYSEEAKARMSFAIGVINPVLTFGAVGGVGLALLSFFQAMYQVVYAVH
jgi:type II secretory pathway component PulF